MEKIKEMTLEGIKRWNFRKSVDLRCRSGDNPYQSKGRTRKSAFTLIELIVVMAVLAILVLLAAPKFLNYAEKARTTQIRNDIKVLETKIDEYLILHEAFPSTFVDGEVGEGQLYDRTGKIDSAPDNLKVVDRTFYPETNLPGNFFVDEGGEVIYEDDKKAQEPIEDPFDDSVEHVEVPDNVDKGDGTDTNPYQIWHLEDLAAINDNLTANYIVMRDLDFNIDEHYLNPGVNKSLWTTGSGWTPINTFDGVFDGNGKKLLSLMINNAPMPAGLFMELEENSVVSNYKLLNVDIDSSNLVGTLAGLSYATIDSITVSGEIVGRGAPVGGIVAIGESITNSKVKANISGNSDVGGILANSQTNNTGDVYPYDLKNLSFEGSITATPGSQNIGGIGGYVTSAEIDNVSFNGTIIADDSSYIGGILGQGQDVLVTNAKATGTIEGADYIGGLFGQFGVMPGATIAENSDSAVSVTGHGLMTGGFAGAATVDRITLCSSTGNVTSLYSAGDDANHVGGFIGVLNSGLVEDSEARGDVSAVYATVGGFIGYNTGETRDNKAYGDVLSTNSIVDPTEGVALSLAGGMFGVHYGSPSANDIAYGSVLGYGYRVGGFIGESNGTQIISGQTYGKKIEGLGQISAFVGKGDGLEISNSIANAETVKGKNAIGSFLGEGNGATLSSSTSNSKLIGQTQVGELVGIGFASATVTSTTFSGTITIE